MGPRLKTFRFSPARGFTLLEILIALMMTATIMGTMFGVFTSSLEVAQNVEESGRVDQMMRMVMDRITRDLRSFVPLEATDMRIGTREENGTESENLTGVNGTQPAVPVPSFTGYTLEDMEDPDEEIVLMSFPSMASLGLGTVFPALRINQIRYILRRQSADKETYILYRQELPFAGLYPGQKPVEIELADGIVRQDDSMPQYIDETGDSLSAWDASAREKEKQSVVPRRILWMLTVTYGDDVLKTYRIEVSPLVREDER